jgi:hypothetical protein
LSTVTGRTGSSGGAIAHGLLNQTGSFDADFRLPREVPPGEYPFTVTVFATETCATDATQTLKQSGSLIVTVTVKQNPKNPQ